MTDTYQELEGYQRNQCQNDIVYLAENYFHYPLDYNLVLNIEDRATLRELVKHKNTELKFSSSRLLAIFIVYHLLFSKSTTILLITQTKHLGRKELESLYFPLNHLGLSFVPEVEVKYTGCLKLSNDVCVRSMGFEDELPIIETKEVIVISYDLLEVPVKLRGKGRWIQVREPHRKDT